MAISQVLRDLGVRRRRLYDVFNVLESLGMITKEKRSLYLWNGAQAGLDTVERLRVG